MADAKIDSFLDAFLADNADEATKPEFEELAATVAIIYAKSAWNSRNPMRSPMPKIASGREEAVLDVIMTRSYPSEPLDVSLARLAKAVQTLGFPQITAFAAAAAYNTFPHLSEIPYEPRRTKRKNRKSPR